MSESMNKNSADKSTIVDIFRELGLSLSDKQMDQFLTYYQFLTERNKVMNLTAITDYTDVVLKHFADSLSVVKVCDMNRYESVIDIGTGAGFPGLPLKIMFPHLEVVLLDSLKKRVGFLNELIPMLSLGGITAIHARAEDAARKETFREQFDLCVSRAVANLSSLSEYCLPFVKTGGMFISYKSTNIDIEIEGAGRAVSLLGGEIKEVKDFCLPHSDIKRSLIVIEKRKAIPAKYPRKAGMPSKEPL